MIYRLHSFGASQDLPYGNSVDGLGGDVPSDVASTAGGAHFAYGSGVVPLGVHRITHRGIYSANVQTNVDGLMGLLGQRLQLWREQSTISSGELQWKYARLLSCRWDRDIEQSQHAEVVSEFEAVGYWKRAFTTAVSRTSTGTLTPTGTGLARVFDAVITFTASSTTTHTFRFQDLTNGIDWTYSSSVTSGQVVTIDCGAFSVLNNGANAYSSFMVNAGHASDYWCVVRPGANSYTLTLSAGAGTFAVTWYESWV